MHSLWLMPAKADQDKLDGLVRLLSRRHGTPLFRAHLTLLGDIPSSTAPPFAALEGIAAIAPPIAAPVSAIELSDSYFTSFYARFPLLPALARLKAASISALSHGAADGFMPHVSLMYGPVPALEKARSAQDMRDMLAGRSVFFDRVALVRSSQEVPIAEWAVLAESPLSGVGS